MPIELDAAKLIASLDCVTWYNGLAEEIIHWKDEGYFDERNGWLNWNWQRFNDFGFKKRNQIEVIWMICVGLFGNYGASPRTGWIENKDAFFDFIDSITETYRE